MWRAGGVPNSLSGAYLEDYASYGYETSWVDRSHQSRVQCTGTITLACLIFKLLPGPTNHRNTTETPKYPYFFAVELRFLTKA